MASKTKVNLRNNTGGTISFGTLNILAGQSVVIWDTNSSEVLAKDNFIKVIDNVAVFNQNISNGNLTYIIGGTDQSSSYAFEHFQILRNSFSLIFEQTNLQLQGISSKSVINNQHGGVIFHGQNEYERLGPGAAGTVLYSNGPGSDVSWVDLGLDGYASTDIPYTNLLQTGAGKEISEPSGWPNAGAANDLNVRISYVESTRTLTLTHLNDYSFWAAGKRFVKTSTENIIWPNVTGTHFFYFDTNGVFQTTQNHTTWLAAIGGNGCPVAALVWNGITGDVIALFEERHGFMPGETHKWAHESIGARWVSGGLLNGFTFGNGNSNADSIFNIENVIFRDEDIRIEVTSGEPRTQTMSPLNCRVYFKNGVNWTYKVPDQYPLLQGGSSYVGGTVPEGRLYFNPIVGLSGSLVQAGNSNYILAHIGVTAEASGYSSDGYSVNWRIFAIAGQKEYATIDSARAGSMTEILALELDTLPFQEFVWLGTVIYQTRDSYTNATKSRIVKSADSSGNLVDYVDWRVNMSGGAGGGISIGSGVETFNFLSSSGNEFMTNNTLGRLYAMAIVPPVTFTITRLTFLIAQNNAGGTGGVAVYSSTGARLAYSSLQSFSLGINTIALNNGSPLVLVGGNLYYFCIESNINSCGPLSIQNSSVYNPPVGANVPPLAFFVSNSRSVDATGFPTNISSYFGQVGTDARKYWILGN